MTSAPTTADLGLPGDLQPFSKHAKALKICSAILYRAARRGEIRAFKLGNRLYASAADIRAYVTLSR